MSCSQTAKTFHEQVYLQTANPVERSGQAKVTNTQVGPVAYQSVCRDETRPSPWVRSPHRSGRHKLTRLCVSMGLIVSKGQGQGQVK